jgi:fatty acid synthase
MMELDVFRKSIMKSHAMLKPHGLDLIDMVVNGTDDTFKDIIHSFVCVISIEVGTFIKHCLKKV